MEIAIAIKIIKLKYGYYMLILLLDHYQYYDEYEVCSIIEKELKETEQLLNIQINRTLDNSFIPDYKAAFWKLGMSGNLACEMLPYYLKDSISEIEKVKSPS